MSETRNKIDDIIRSSQLLEYKTDKIVDMLLNTFHISEKLTDDETAFITSIETMLMTYGKHEVTVNLQKDDVEYLIEILNKLIEAND